MAASLVCVQYQSKSKIALSIQPILPLLLLRAHKTVAVNKRRVRQMQWLCRSVSCSFHSTVTEDIDSLP